MSEFSKEKLIKYLECVKGLETSLYSQKYALDKMRKEEAFCQKNASLIKEIPKEMPMLCSEKKNAWPLVGSMACIGGIIGLFISVPFADGRYGAENLWGILIGAIIGYFSGIGSAKARTENIISNNEIEYHRVEFANQKIEQQNEKNRELVTAYKNKSNVVKVEIEFLEKSIKETTRQLNDYYDLDVIYPKYRGMVYVCSIYEYIESGRCDGLVGPYGAYNLLENDIKFARVVEKMDNIISNLEQIKENQNELYYAIRETNNQLSELGDSIERVAKGIEQGNANIEDLKKSMSNIEYNSKVSADSEQFTAAYHFFKN